MKSTSLFTKMYRYGKGDEHELIASYANHLASHNNLEYLGLATGKEHSQMVLGQTSNSSNIGGVNYFRDFVSLFLGIATLQ